MKSKIFGGLAMVFSLWLQGNAQPFTFGTTWQNNKFCSHNLNHTLYITGGLSYQWKLNGVAIAGATGTNYHPTVSGAYSVTATTTAHGSPTLGPIPITVIQTSAPFITASGDPGSVCSGAASTYMLTSSPGTNYQWKRNGVVIAGATGSTYKPNQPGSYTVVVTTSCGDEEPPAIVVQGLPGVVPTGPIGVQGDPTKFCASNINDRLIAPAGYGYQWKAGNGIIGGAVGQTYHPTGSGSYSVDIRDAAGCVITTLGPTQIVVQNGGDCPSNTIAQDQQPYSVNPFTGGMSVSIPLFTVQDGDLTVPGVLSYAATGVRVTDDAGWVGQNWNISVQSCGIFREVRGLPDDYAGSSSDARRGWLINSQATSIAGFTPATDNNPASCVDEATNYNYLNGIDFTQDTEPDVFNVNVPGLAFQFYFDENRQPRVAPYADVVITPNTTTGPITSFTVKDQMGVEYRFEDGESTTKSVYAANTYYYVRETKAYLQPITYNTGWRLTRIVSASYGQINFSYRTVELANEVIVPRRGVLVYRYPVIFANATGANGKIEYSRRYTLKVLSKIASPGTEVNFNSGTSTTSVDSLTDITVYDKREGVSKQVDRFGFYYVGTRNFLRLIRQYDAKMDSWPKLYEFDYYNGNVPSSGSTTGYPSYANTSNKDEWGYYKLEANVEGYSLYDETVCRGSLKKVLFPKGGYSVFFYEPHEYLDGATTVRRGGLRVRKVLTYDGVSSTPGMVEYEYKQENGQSSGKVQHIPARSLSVVRVDKYYGTLGARYRDVGLANPTTPVSVLNGYFTVTTADELSNSDLVQGSAVAYGRVKAVTSGGGYSVYEYDLPASYGELSANTGEWGASSVLIARQPTGNSYCFEKGPVPEGYNVFPFPPHPDFDFAQGLLKKQTDYRQDGVKRRELILDYQRVYEAAATRKIYALAIEELPTYYHNGSSYVDGKMFLFSRYAVYTGVRTAIKKSREIVFPSSDGTQQHETVTEYFYESTYHRAPSRVVVTNSDNSKLVTRVRYVSDYPVVTPSSPETTALKALQTARRGSVRVESVSSRVDDGVEKVMAADLQTFQVISGKAYAHRNYSFRSDAGESSFAAAALTSGGATLAFDSRYVLTQTVLAVDGTGLPKEVVGRDRQAQTTIMGFGGTLPVISVSNARSSEMLFSNFEASTDRGFSTPWGPAVVAGRHGSAAVVLPAGTGAPNALIAGVSAIKTSRYIYSCWLLPASSGTLTVTLRSTGTTTASAQIPFQASAAWRYYAVTLTVPSAFIPAGFSAEVRSTVAVPVDDVALYPADAVIQTNSYALPFGPSIETDTRGNCRYFTYDHMGRVILVQDRDGNIIRKFDHYFKP